MPQNFITGATWPQTITRGECEITARLEDADEWGCVGVILSVSCGGVLLDSHAASLRFVESDPAEIANELIAEAING